MSDFIKHDTYLSDKLYIPMIYNGAKFIPYFAYIITKVIVDVRTMARVGEAVVGYSIVGMRWLNEFNKSKLYW